jgi:prepilin-type N-terminal cleavage/methylation domain-containing protein
MRRPHPAAERGFTLVEILVVMLIIGILAAVGIATFLNQRSKAQDADAKSAASTAAKAMTIWHTDHDTYAGATQVELADIEVSLGRARNLTVTGDDSTFAISVDSAAGGAFSITKLASGAFLRDCSEPGVGGCAATADADGNRW